MVSGKPPRRSKTTEEPVIIDLKATEVAPEKPDEKPPEELATSVETTKEPATEPPVVPSEPQTRDAHTAATPETSAEKRAVEDEAKSVSDNEAQPAHETKSADTVTEESTERSNSTSAFAAHAPKPEQEQATPAAAKTSTLLAAGITGGLIALIAAGSMQYAGLLPAMGTGNNNKVAALSAEVESLKQTIAKGQPAADTSALEARLAQLESAQQNPAQTVDPTAITELQTKLASTEQTIDQLKSDVTGRIQSLTSGQTDLSDKLTAIQTKLDKPRDDIEVARAIAASALKTAADRGGPFLAELRTLGSIAPEDPAVKALEPYAATGTASRAELLQRFGPVADSILSAINQPAESANIGERLMASAMSIIKVRPVGNVAGDSPSAIVARIEDKIRNGDLKGAAAEWETLPEVGRSVSASFKKALDARIAVEAQVSDALARSVAGRQG